MATNNPAPQRGTRQAGTSTSQAKSVPVSADKEASKTKDTAKTQEAKPAPATGSSSVATRTASTPAPSEAGTKAEPKGDTVERVEKSAPAPAPSGSGTKVDTVERVEKSAPAPAAEPVSSLVKAVEEAQGAPASGDSMDVAVDTLVSDEITREAVERSAGNTSSPILHVVDVIEDLRAERDSAEADVEAAGMIRHFLYLLMGVAVPSVILQIFALTLVGTWPSLARLILVANIILVIAWVLCFGLPALRSASRVEDRTVRAEDSISRSLETAVTQFKDMVLKAEGNPRGQ